MPPALKAPVLSNVPSADDMEASIHLSKRVLRRYLEAVDKLYTSFEAEQDARDGIVPKSVQVALRVAEMDGRDKVAEKEIQRVLHTFLPRTALAASHLPPAPPLQAVEASPRGPQTYDGSVEPPVIVVNPDDYS